MSNNQRDANSNRKILQAKRRGTNNNSERLFTTLFNSNERNTQNQTRTGTKRQNHDINTDCPPNKRRNNNTYSSANTTSKNLAERRLQNLRKSLEEKRLQEEQHNRTPIKTNTVKTETISNKINASLKSPDKFTVQERLIKVRTATKTSNYNSPCSSNVQNIGGNFNLENKLVIPAKLAADTSDVNDEETMDWSPVNEETILENILEIRKEIDYIYSQPISSINSPVSITSIPEVEGVFIVVDTNIFLSQICVLDTLKDRIFDGFGKVLIVVPWMVIQELDYMKDTNNIYLSRGARKAVKYINAELSKDNSRFKGQTVLEASKHNYSSSNPDDGILFCCLQLVEQHKYVVLLSNDINLRNKALVNKISSFNSTEIINNLTNLKSSEVNSSNLRKSVQKIKILLSNMLTHIIEKEMLQAFGEIWIKMAKVQPPLTMYEALNCLDKYWRTVFAFSLQKQCKQTIDEFLLFVKRHHHDGDNLHSRDFHKFVEFSLSLCIYLKNGYPNYRTVIDNCLHSIQKCTV